MAASAASGTRIRRANWTQLARGWDGGGDAGVLTRRTAVTTCSGALPSGGAGASGRAALIGLTSWPSTPASSAPYRPRPALASGKTRIGGTWRSLAQRYAGQVAAQVAGG